MLCLVYHIFAAVKRPLFGGAACGMMDKINEKRECAMHPQFAQLTPNWFYRAFVYTGSIGEFRYRFFHEKGGNTITASVYSRICFELAGDVVSREFPWDDDGVKALQQWLQSAWEHYEQTGAVPQAVENA